MEFDKKKIALASAAMLSAIVAGIYYHREKLRPMLHSESATEPIPQA